MLVSNAQLALGPLVTALSLASHVALGSPAQQDQPPKTRATASMPALLAQNFTEHWTSQGPSWIVCASQASVQLLALAFVACAQQAHTLQVAP